MLRIFYDLLINITHFSDPQKQMHLQLDDSLQGAHDALRACDKQLSELRIQVDKQLAQVANRTTFRDR